MVNLQQQKRLRVAQVFDTKGGMSSEATGSKVTRKTAKDNEIQEDDAVSGSKNGYFAPFSKRFQFYVKF